MRSWLVVAALVLAGTASGVEVTPHAGAEGPVPVGPPLPVARSAHAVRIEAVEVIARPAPAVRVRMSAHAELRARTLRPDKGAPARIYIDVQGSALDPGVKRSIAGPDPIVRVRSGQFDPSTARIIIDLARETAFVVTGTGRTATITFGAGPLARAPASVVPKAKEAPRKPAAKPRPEAAPPTKANDPVPPAVELAAPVAGPMGPRAPEPAADAPVSLAAAAAGEPPSEAVPVTPPPRMTRAGSALFAWPDLDSALYTDPAAAPFRSVLDAWRGGAPRTAAPTDQPGSPAALYLAADVAFLEAAAGRASYLAAAEAYERALREAPDFADVPRGQFMLGQSNLALGFGPEAGAAFGTVEQRHPESPLVPDALLGQATSLRLRHRLAEARSVLDRAVSRARGELLCRVQLERVAAAATPAAAVDVYRLLGETCPHAFDDPVM
ncbi:MAG TPA: AMIN domain-containing protein, partial [Candidatus Binatus sp.]|nr:AMIN domain-containing protein [Candidatus Binatus sp.]